MSGGLFGYTSFLLSTQPENANALTAVQGYNFLKYQHEPEYEETKYLFGDDNAYQRIRPFQENKLKAFSINDIGRTYHGTYGLNASYYNGLVNYNEEPMPYGTQINRPSAYPNHYYNTQPFSPAYLGLTEPAYPI